MIFPFFYENETWFQVGPYFRGKDGFVHEFDSETGKDLGILYDRKGCTIRNKDSRRIIPGIGFLILSGFYALTLITYLFFA